MRPLTRLERQRLVAFALWTRLTALAVVGGFALAWIVLLALKHIQG